MAALFHIFLYDSLGTLGRNTKYENIEMKIIMEIERREIERDTSWAKYERENIY